MLKHLREGNSPSRCLVDPQWHEKVVSNRGLSSAAPDVEHARWYEKVVGLRGCSLVAADLEAIRSLPPVMHDMMFAKRSVLQATGAEGPGEVVPGALEAS
uniref:Uncharacterized protein n=1 Tax=Haptolina brevifila TaxID=156173 RepID=A0A7S2JAT6_9EUKA|mmetsp:Transcript_7899/g.16066  ORF Transcript_7899/g.16066 Transcript_7899/m.16066 type:complete len:100 (+) Transcript_7899:91-390(+)